MRQPVQPFSTGCTGNRAMKSATPANVLSYIQEAYHRYYDSAFWMRDEYIMRERRALLDEAGLTAQEILLEAVLPYPSMVSIEEACAAVGIEPGIARQLAEIVFGNDFKLRRHQAQSLETSLAPSDASRRNVVVTSGTGSGKTESFMLPVIARLLCDRHAGNELSPVYAWWERDWSAEDHWEGLRSRTGSGPTPAVRAMLLYPTNALVEDQISRLPAGGLPRADPVRQPTLLFWKVHRRHARRDLLPARHAAAGGSQKNPDRGGRDRGHRA